MPFRRPKTGQLPTWITEVIEQAGNQIMPSTRQHRAGAGKGIEDIDEEALEEVGEMAGEETADRVRRLLVES